MPVACCLIHFVPMNRCCGSVGRFFWPVLFLLVAFFCPVSADAGIPNHIQRIEIRPKTHFTRITVSLAANPKYTVSKISGNRLRIRFSDTEGPLFKQLRRYSDANVGGLVLSRRGNDMLLTFAIAPDRAGWRQVHIDGIPAFSLDVGPLFRTTVARSVLPGRERIVSGAEKLLRDFDPPINPEIPFMPTNRQALKDILDDADQRLFLAAEGELYKGRLTAAEEAFTPFVSGTTKIRPLALYRLAETQYRLQKYGQALGTFREAIKEWQEYMVQNPSAMFYYGDSIARGGDLPGGRQQLAKLIVANAEKKYAPVLLVRMADVLSRQGDESNARAIYTTVSGAFKENKAYQIARIKLADRDFFHVTPDNYNALSVVYAEIAATTTNFDLRDEASFKHALLEAINGSAEKALDLTVSYQKRFPKGVYSTVIRDIREDLVALVYQNGDWGKNPAALLRLVTDNQDYLASAIRVPGFLPAVTAAFEKAGHSLDLITLYAGLLERPWVGADNVPYLALQVADQADILGDTVMARKTLQNFLLQNPGHAQSRWAKERLGAIQFAAREFAEVRTGLSWLLQKREIATYPSSYYYLGRALWESKEYARSTLAMESYLAAVKGLKEQPPLVGDAYYVAALSRQAQGDRKGAALLLESGLKVIPKNLKDQFLYKMGEIATLDGRITQARSMFEQVVKEGKDPDWQRLARQALEDGALVTPPPIAPKKK